MTTGDAEGAAGAAEPISADVPDLDVQTIRVVRAIDEHGTVTGAARALGISQPAISQHLQRAEARLGAPLVRRVGRSVRLSEAGRIVADIAPMITDRIDTARRRIGEIASARAGRVGLAGFPSASATVLPQLLSTLRRGDPGLSLTYTEAEPTEATSLVLSGGVDLAIVARYSGEPENPDWRPSRGLTLVPLYIDEMLLILPADHPLSAERTVRIEDLQDDEWIAGCPLCRGHTVDTCRSAGFEPRIAYETDNVSAVLGFVSHGLGVAILPRLSLSTAALPHGVVVARTQPRSVRDISLLAATETLQVPAVAATVAALTALDGAPWHLAAHPDAAAPRDVQPAKTLTRSRRPS